MTDPISAMETIVQMGYRFHVFYRDGYYQASIRWGRDVQAYGLDTDSLAGAILVAVAKLMEDAEN